jgi:hypothetical protein
MGCSAQSANYDDKDWTVDHGAEQKGSWREAESLFGESEAQVDNFDYEPRSVRHDLQMQPNATPDARCRCMDAVAGLPAQNKFAWAGERPNISPNDMVIALRPQSCQGTAAGHRPSIKAVDKRGNDVVVVIEELVQNRPQQLGAIIPKPLSAGELYVAPAAAGPYGRGSDGKACRVPLEQRMKRSR